MGAVRPVKLRDVEIGTGTPKIIVPIAEKTADAILARAREILGCACDVVEWRVDVYEDLFDTREVLSTLKALRAVFGETPILFTVRTKREGGAREVDMDVYTALNTAAAQSGDADIIDVQIFSGDETVRKNIDAIHAAGCKVIGSCHEFERTPGKAELIRRMRKAQDMGADISKLAVMPRSPADVITLLDATQEMRARYADRPAITMSMGSGVVSRLCGEYFGSDAAFGMIGRASAPGQIPAGQLSAVLAVLHQALAVPGSV